MLCCFLFFAPQRVNFDSIFFKSFVHRIFPPHFITATKAAAAQISAASKGDEEREGLPERTWEVNCSTGILLSP